MPGRKTIFFETIIKHKQRALGSDLESINQVDSFREARVENRDWSIKLPVQAFLVKILMQERNC